MAAKAKKGDEAKEVDWEDKALHEALQNRQPLPDGIRIRSPYGQRQVDVGSQEIVGEATGDDGNAGSSGASVPRGGAKD